METPERKAGKKEEEKKKEVVPERKELPLEKKEVAREVLPEVISKREDIKEKREEGIVKKLKSKVFRLNQSNEELRKTICEKNAVILGLEDKSRRYPVIEKKVEVPITEKVLLPIEKIMLEMDSFQTLIIRRKLGLREFSYIVTKEKVEFPKEPMVGGGVITVN